MSFKLTIDGTTHVFDKKVELLSLTNGDKDIICATVNGRVRELNYDVYYDADIKFLKVNDHDAMGIYERGIPFEVKEPRPSREFLAALNELDYMEKHPNEYKAYDNIADLKEALESDE